MFLSCFKGIKMTKFVFIIFVCAASLSACNTVQGMGKDIEKGGQAIEKVAK